jgi:hypothetical protein
MKKIIFLLTLLSIAFTSCRAQEWEGDDIRVKGKILYSTDNGSTYDTLVMDLDVDSTVITGDTLYFYVGSDAYKAYPTDYYPSGGGGGGTGVVDTAGGQAATYLTYWTDKDVIGGAYRYIIDADTVLIISNTYNDNGMEIQNIGGGYGIYVANGSTGDGLFVNNSSTGYALNLLNSSSGRSVNIANSGTGYGNYITNSSSGLGSYVINSSTGDGQRIANNSSGRGFYGTNSSSGNFMTINNSNAATGDAFAVQRDGSDQVVIDSTGRTFFYDTVYFKYTLDLEGDTSWVSGMPNGALRFDTLIAASDGVTMDIPNPLEYVIDTVDGEFSWYMDTEDGLKKVYDYRSSPPKTIKAFAIGHEMQARHIADNYVQTEDNRQWIILILLFSFIQFLLIGYLFFRDRK